LNEAEKIKRLKSGDASAFELFVKEFQLKVYNTCLGLLQNEEDAEDISQEVFITVFQSIRHFKERSSLSTWVYRITVTRSLEFLRMKKRKKRFAFFQTIFSDEKGEIRTQALHFYHPGVQLENKERAAILFKAIEQLPENQKTAFILHKLEELSYAEIAEVMKLSVSSIESLMFRAKQNLQKLLGRYYEKNEK
jgi:RNA polymerase sigma factor (sigma-70 family)